MPRRPQPYADFQQPKPYEGPLDLRAPEDQHPASGQGDDAPIWSPAIRQALNDFDRAIGGRDLSEMKRAASGVVDATTAYYKMSGVPLFAHDPVPPQMLARHLVPGVNTSRAAANFLDLFDDSVKPMLKLQVGDHLRANAAGQSSSVLPRQTQTTPPSGPRSQFGLPPLPRPKPQISILGVPIGADGPLDEYSEVAPDPNVVSPRSPSRNFGPPWYTPGAWRNERDPTTAGNTLLVGPERLTDAQKRNLAERIWIFPTDSKPEVEPVGANYPFFGASRSERGGPTDYHGGFDSRFKNPPQGSGQKPDKQVVAPTRATFKGLTPLTKNGLRVINMITFDLGDGLELQGLHIEPTLQILALDRQLKLELSRAAAATSARRPVPKVNYPELDAGVLLGEVDWPMKLPTDKVRPGKHDHAHWQLMATVDGRRATVDITPYMERRARRFLRQPTNDWLERRFDELFGEELPQELLPPK